MRRSQPPFKFAMCNQFNADACCLPIHHTEIQDAYTHMVDVAYRCSESISESNPALRSYFCMFCNPNQLQVLCASPAARPSPPTAAAPQYMGCCSSPSWNTTTTGSNRVFGCSSFTPYDGTSCDARHVNTLRLCPSFASDLFPPSSPGNGLDKCGFSLWIGATEVTDPSDVTGYNPNGIVAWGDVDGSTEDDPVVPSKYWAEGAKGFVRDIRPPLLEQFFIHVADDNTHCFNGPAAALQPASALVALVVAAATLVQARRVV